MELNVSGEICSFAQEEAPGLLSDWELQQTAKEARIGFFQPGFFRLRE
jgi:hypothetical protein